MLDQKLQQKLLQKLSPQQIQMIKLLEVPAMQLEQRIKKELEENPALEEGPEEDEIPDEENDDVDEEQAEREQEEFALDDYLNDEDIPDYRLQINNTSKDDERRDEIPYASGASFHENLIQQFNMRVDTEREEILGEYIIGNIDDDGYLRREVENMVDDLAFLQNITTTAEELNAVLQIIQDLEPAGVGARDLRECLLLQIERKDQSHPSVALTKTVLTDFFEEFSRRHYEKIMSRLGKSEEEMKAVIDEVLKLNPKPGGSFNDPYTKSAQHIIPDFILEESDGGLELSLNNRNIPELKVSRGYSEMLESYSRDRKAGKQNKDAVMFVKQKLDAARWFIDAMRQRQNTLLLTMNAILEYQKEYFVEGDDTKLKPMILKDVAEMTGLDISTVSRVANSKYIQTHFGIYPLKFFFSEGMQTDAGDEVSTREIKRILQECLNNEDKRRPLTDEKLTEILQEKGYQIARRTVAKYREQLNIPVARMRKEIK
ncbi:MAG TPA: RNA polymerase sigma-54 factor [Bacteroidales bacterium]|jgi:RNA polymerase sigma-54 factor|nr:RNA polymerase sigma-54 factor [Bacteroidales bacterium]